MNMNSMSMQKKLVKLFLVAFAIAVPMLTQAQEIKIGFVNQERIVRDSAVAKTAEKKIEAEFAKRNKDLQDMEVRLRSLRDRLDREAPTTSETERTRRQRELAELDRDFQRKGREVQEDFNQRRNEEYAQIIERARVAIKVVAEQDKLDLVVLDAAYVSPRIDITDKVLRALANQR
jgi:outer membrane protein